MLTDYASVVPQRMSNHLCTVTITMGDNLKLDALKYLIDTGHLNKCTILAFQHSEKSQGIGIASLPFIYDLEIDLILLNDSSRNLYEKFVQCPEKTRNIFRNVIQEKMIEYLTYNKCRPVHTELHIHCTIIPHITKIRNIKPTALILLKRYVLTAMTVAVTYSICNFYRCTNTFCIRNLMGFYLTEEDVQMEEWKKCELCYQSMIEDQARGGEGQRVLANFIPITGFRSHKPGMYRAITCSVTESLIRKLELGSEYHICGYQKTQWFEILGLEKYNPFGIKYEPYLWPSTILSLKSMIDQTHPNSPWAFVMFLASQLGHSICPSKSSLSLKMGLLLSLSNLNGNKVVPVMCVGPSTKIAAELMNHASKFAERHLRNGSPIVGSTKEIGNWTWQESGILIMAKNGVCSLGNWEGLRLSEREMISSTIGANKIKVNTKCVKGFGTIPIYSLKTAIWTYWGYSRSERHNSMVKKFIDIFGVPFLADSNNDDAYVSYVLRSATGVNNSMIEDTEYRVSVHDMAEYLRVINGRDVFLTEKARQMIKNYFVVCRRARGDQLPSCSIELISALAENHARLALRCEVTSDDVVAIIRLYEESLCYLYGYTITRPPSLELKDIDKIDDHMMIFEKWLNNYLKSLISDTDREE